MTNIESLVGTYKVSGSNLLQINGSNNLMLRKRANVTKTKPLHYLLKVQSPSNIYVSSLYDSKDGGYQFDFNNIRYKYDLVEKSEGQTYVVIQKREGL